MKNQKDVVIETKHAGLTLKQRFESLGLTSDAITARIESVTKSGNWYIFVGNILTIANKFESFVMKLNAGENNEDYIKETETFFSTFKPGDYLLSNVQVRQAGETWNDESGNSGQYKESYICVPFTSNMLFLGSDSVYNTRKRESDYAKMNLKALELVED